jgi:signal transduction histidine kinase
MTDVFGSKNSQQEPQATASAADASGADKRRPDSPWLNGAGADASLSQNQQSNWMHDENRAQEDSARQDPEVQGAISKAIAFGRKLRAQTMQAVGHPLSASQQFMAQQSHDPELEARLGQLSYELRTPLTSIRSYSEILVNHPDLSPRQRAHYLQIILDESERLEKVLEKQGA